MQLLTYCFRYRKLSLKHHPHRNKDLNAEADFALIAEAYDTLSNGLELHFILCLHVPAERKAIYDRFGFNGLAQGAPTAENGAQLPHFTAHTLQDLPTPMSFTGTHSRFSRPFLEPMPPLRVSSNLAT